MSRLVGQFARSSVTQAADDIAIVFGKTHLKLLFSAASLKLLSSAASLKDIEEKHKRETELAAAKLGPDAIIL